jgi:peroxiredoxin
MPTPAVGDAFPASGITLHGATPGDAVKLDELIAGKTVVIASVPGAFTPTCHTSHIPGYIEGAADLKAAGADEIIVVW